MLNLTVGQDAAVNNLATTIDVSTTGVKTVTLGTAARFPFTDSRTFKAYYTAGGSAPTTGKAFIVLEYIITQNDIA